MTRHIAYIVMRETPDADWLWAVLCTKCSFAGIYTRFNPRTIEIIDPGDALTDHIWPHTRVKAVPFPWSLSDIGLRRKFGG